MRSFKTNLMRILKTLKFSISNEYHILLIRMRWNLLMTMQLVLPKIEKFNKILYTRLYLYDTGCIETNILLSVISALATWIWVIFGEYIGIGGTQISSTPIVSIWYLWQNGLMGTANFTICLFKMLIVWW